LKNSPGNERGEEGRRKGGYLQLKCRGEKDLGGASGQTSRAQKRDMILTESKRDIRTDRKSGEKVALVKTHIASSGMAAGAASADTFLKKRANECALKKIR